MSCPPNPNNGFVAYGPWRFEMNIYDLFKDDAEMEFAEIPVYWSWVWPPSGHKMLFCWNYWEAES